MRALWISLAGAGTLWLAASAGCKDLDDYSLQPGSPPVQGGSGGTGLTGGGGSGGSPVDCSGVNSTGVVFVTTPATTTDAGDGGACSAPTALNPGIDVFALDPNTGNCLGATRIESADASIVSSSLQVKHQSGTAFYVAGGFRGGNVRLPNRCSNGSNEALEEPVGATASIFVAALTFNETDFCTSWTRIASTQVIGAEDALRVNAVSVGSNGVAIAGSLGGALTNFEDGADGVDASGGTFFARYSTGGLLSDVTAIGSGAFGDPPPPGSAIALDGAMALDAIDGGWLVSGTIKNETPECHGCAGVSQVVDGAAVCDEAGGAGGMGGTGGLGGMGGTGGGGAVLDGQNAFLLNRRNADATCQGLETFGADTPVTGQSDVQIGFGISALNTSPGCRAYWTGLAGRTAWPFDAGNPDTSLFDTGGPSADGFVARLDGTSGLNCGAGAGEVWNIRLSPTPVTATVWGSRIEAERCSDGAVLTAFVDGAAGKTIGLHRCDGRGACDANAFELDLEPTSAQQLAVMELDAEGSLRWATSMGPVEIEPAVLGGTTVGASVDHLALDGADNILVALRTSGPFVSQGLERFGCDSTLENAPAGTYLLRLRRGGFVEQAQCDWAVRIDR